MKRSVGQWCAVLLVAGVLSGMPRAASAAGAASYVGSHACTPCHQRQYQDWVGSNHALAMQPATDKTVLGNFRDARFTQFGVTSRFFKKGGSFFVHTDGPDGTLADFAVTHTFGVEPLQQYLLELPGGRLQSLPIAWDVRPKARGGQRWFSLYPNEKIAPGDPLHWTGADQTWNYMCASCHSTNLEKHYDATARRYATTWSDRSVGCEACHGPGSLHLSWAAQARGATAPDGNNGLVVHLTPAQRTTWAIDAATGNAHATGARPTQTEIGVCAPCHARRSVIGADFLPGQPLLDSYVPAGLTEGLYHADGQIEGEVYEYGSFVQSKMYHQGVTCSNCHDPHTLALRAQGNAVCAQCHLASKYDSPSHHFHPAGSAGASCAGCHMPTTTYMIVDPRHDHSLRIPRPDLSVSLGVPNACNTCHTERDAQWARATVREWYGHDPSGYQTYAAALHAGRSGAPDAERRLAALVRDPSQPGIARATALQLLRTSLTPASIDVLELGLRDDDPLVRRAAVEALEAVPPAQQRALAMRLLDDPVRAVRIEAARLLAAAPAEAVGPDGRARIDRGIEEYVAAQHVEADRPEAHTNLGTLYGELGQYSAAEAEFGTAISLRAGFTPAYVNLADVYRVQQRDSEGERVLRQGIANAPTDAALHHALGLLLVREKQLKEAVDELQLAVRLRPEEARYGYVLGVALASSGQPDRALDVLGQAQQRHPADRDLLWALATINRDRGRTQDAEAYARRLVALAPDDSSARQLLQQLEASHDEPGGSGERVPPQ